ncbi:MAG: hypothetical protein WBQ26_00985 [Gemmatimonadaceae bacterium]|nr:hypothetical protein [Gemmatimonadaceae bacterium]
MTALVALAACNAPPPTLSSQSTTTGSASFTRNPCSIADTLTLGAAQTARVDCSNGGTTVTVAGKGASYLVIPEFPTDNAADAWVPYNVAASAYSAPPASGSRMAMIERGLAAAVSMASVRAHTMQSRAYAALRAKERKLYTAGAFAATSARARAAVASRHGQVQASVAMTAVPAAGSVRNFHVLSNFSGNAWKAVAARLAYVGNDVLLYIDTLAPANGFTPTQLQQFGQYFDQTLYPIDTAAFGPPSDIDNNGHVIMLMSPVVNADTPSSQCNTLGYIAGFFDSEDFNSASDPNSNQGEIFYSIVPDPLATVSCQHSVAEVGGVVPATFLHEMQHLIDFSTHVILHGGQPETGWLDEGLSINAEELGSLYYEAKCPPPACRADPTQIFPDSAEGFVQGFLYDSYQYGLLPDTASVTLHSDADNGFSWRGGDWAMVHYLGDQFGHAVWRRLENGTSIGVANIVAATGEPFPQLFSDFGTALYTDSLPGLPRTTAPAANRFVTRNLRQLWARLYANSAPATDIPYAMPIVLFSITSDTSTSVMDPGTMSFYRLDTPDTSTAVTIQFSGPGGAKLPAGLNPQLAIFRLPVGQ